MAVPVEKPHIDTFYRSDVSYILGKGSRVNVGDRARSKYRMINPGNRDSHHTVAIFALPHQNKSIHEYLDIRRF